MRIGQEGSSDRWTLFFWCAEHDRELGGESPLYNLMEVK